MWYPVSGIRYHRELDPNVANVGWLQSPGVKSEVVVLYFEPLTTQNLKFSGVPEGPLTGAQRANSMAKSILSIEFTNCDF